MRSNTIPLIGRHVCDLLRDNAHIRGDASALITDELTFSWRDLLDRVSVVSGMIGGQGLAVGDRVAVLSKSSLAHAIASYSITWGGQVHVPLNFRLSALELQQQIEDCDAALVLADQEFFTIAETWPEHIRSRFRLITNVVEFKAENRTTLEPAKSSEQVAVMIYTGGTTGQPKGVELSSRAMLANGKVVSDALQYGPDDRSLLLAPMFHISGLAVIWTAAIQGAACVLSDGFSPAEIGACLQRHKVTILFLVPTMIQMLFDAPDFDSAQFAGVKNFLYGASPISPTLLKRLLETLPNLRVTQAYGQTEFCPITILNHEDHLDALANNPGKLRQAGRPGPQIEIKIVDPSGNPLPTGIAGEVLAKGPNQMTRYWGMPELTRTTIEDGFVHTGDIGFLDEEDYLTLVDRSKDMIVTGGENVYSREVENAMASHPLVSHVAVIAVPDDKWGERVHAVVECSQAADEDSLIAHCRARIAGYKCPKSISFVDKMPLTEAGKVDKKILRAPYWAGRTEQVS